jgi:DNA polymerase II small subunit/DNA polymerase delta subunit B
MSFVDSCTSKGFLVGSNVNFEGVDCNKFLNYVESLSEKPFIITQDLINSFKKDFFNADLSSDVKVEVSELGLRDKGLRTVEVVNNYKLNNKMRDMNDWFDFYLNRYNKMRLLLENRKELKNAVSINSINKMSGKNDTATIGIVSNIHKSKNDNYLIKLEDPTVITPVGSSNLIK